MPRTFSRLTSVAVVAVCSVHIGGAGLTRPEEGLRDTVGGAADGIGTAGLIGLVAVVGCLSLTLVLVLRERHHRRRLSELLGRLNEFEEVWQEAGELDNPGQTTASGADENRQTKNLIRLPRGPLSSLISALSPDNLEQLPVPDRLDYSAFGVLQSRLDRRMTPAGLAGELNVSLRTLQRGLTRTLDCTPSEFIIAVTMREAKRRLVVDGLQVQEVSRSLGFANPFHFSRRFKAYYGVTPSELQRTAKTNAS